MSLYKRKDSPFWWVKLSHNGRQIQKSTGISDRIKAREYHDKLKAQLWDLTRLGTKPSHTWEEAVVRWLDEKAHKASIEGDRRNLRWLHSHLSGLTLGQIDRDVVDRITQARKRSGVTNATTNRMLALLRSILRAAVNDWEWLDRSPKVRLLPEAQGRVRFLTPDELARLFTTLPAHLKPMVAFSICTGARQRNVRELKWSQVDLERKIAWIHPDEAKARKGIPLPLTDDAVAVLSSQRGKHPECVFTYRGEPVRYVHNTGWRAALKRAGIENFRWHDLRHTWATLHAQAGTPMHVLRELGGWASDTMVRRYAHFTQEHLASYVQNFGERVTAVPQGVYDLATSGGGKH
ncbi:MAG: tyrosine-type recombinase/integrase [Steroidobacteraceae bacterium]